MNKRLLTLAVLCFCFPAFKQQSIAQRKPQSTARQVSTPGALADRWEAMLKSKQYDEVVAETTESIERNPTMVFGFSFRARAYDELAKYDLGRKDAEDVVRLLVKPRTAREFEAVCGARTMLFNPWNEVIADCTAAIKLNPRLSGALLLRANAYSKNKQYDLAIKDYTTVVSVDTRNARAYSGRAFTYRLSKQVDLALADIDRAIGLEPREADFYHTRGLIHGQRGDSAKAIADYTKAIELMPSFYFAYLNRASLYIEAGDQDRAFWDYTKAIETWGGKVFAAAYLQRAKIHTSRGEDAKAIADLTRAIEIDPRDGSIPLERGLLYFKTEQIDMAIVDFTRAIGLDASNADAWLFRGASYYKKKIYDLALSDISKALESSPKDSTAHNVRGNVYFAKKEYDLAIVDYTTALELNPERGHFYLRQRADAYETKGDKTRASEDRNKADDLAKKWACSYNARGASAPGPGLVGAILVNTTSASIKVFVDGALRCETAPNGNCSFAVFPGRHPIVVRRAGSEDVDRIFDAPKPPGRLSIVFGASGFAPVDCGSINARYP